MLQDIKRTSKHTIIYSLGNVSTKVIGILLIPLYTNEKYLSTSDFGALAVLEATLQLLVGVLIFAMTSGLTRWYWDEKFASVRKSIFFTSLTFLFILVVPAVFLLSQFADFFSEAIFASGDYTYLIRLTIFSAGLQVINNQTLTLVRLQSRSVHYIILQTLKFSLFLGLILYGILHKGKGLDAIWEAQLISELLMLVSLLPYIYKNIQIKFQTSILREMIIYGLPIMLASISGTLLAITDRYMLNSMSGLSDTGIYSLGFRIANTLKIVITTSILSAVTPLKMQKMNAPDNKRFYTKIMTYTLFVFIIGLLGVSLFSLEFIKVFTNSSEYWASNGIIPFISFSLLFALMKENASIGLIIMKKTRIIGLLIFITSLLNIGFNLLLIPLFNIYGAATATLISQMIFFLSISYFSQKAFYIPYEWKKIIIMITVAAALVIAGILVSDMILYIRLTIKLLLLVLFPVILYFTNFFEKAELITIRKIFQAIRERQKLRTIFENIGLREKR